MPVSPSPGSVATECAPEDVGLSSGRLAMTGSKLIRRFVDEGEIPNGQVLVARRGKVCFQHSSGYLNIESKTPLPDDALFRIYSMSKPVTSVCLMTLHEEGAFSLNDPISWYLPEFAMEKMRVYTGGLVQKPTGRFEYETAPCTNDITVQMLMNHTSGLSYGFDMGGSVCAVDRLYQVANGGPGTMGNREIGPDLSLEEYTKRLAAMPLVCQPGTEWNYSLSVDVQGRLIEVLTGLSFFEALNQRIFVPLGMSDTFFTVPEDKMSRFTSVYTPNPYSPEEVAKFKDPAMAAHRRLSPLAHLSNDELDALPNSGKLLNLTKATAHIFVAGANKKPATPKYESGGGGLVSSMADYYQFAAMLAAGGKGLNGARILSRKTVQYMTINHLPCGLDLGALSSPQYAEIGTAGAGFGLGFSTIVDPTRQRTMTSVGSFAWGGAASTYFWVDPEEELVVILMTQLLYNGVFNRPGSKYYKKQIPLRAMLQAIVYGAIEDGALRTDQQRLVGTAVPEPRRQAKL